MTPSSSAVTVQARAKINLYLHITGKRTDGYHLLDSLVAFAEFGDRISVTHSDDLSLEITGPFAAGLASENDNLVLRATNALASATGSKPAVRIMLEKNLPVAAGIGGGSADAAATLLALNQLWGNQVEAAVLRDIGLTLGADIPVCLLGQTAQMSGIGEVVHASPPIPPIHTLLVNPLKPVSTPEVFNARGGGFSVPAPLTQPIETTAALAEFLAYRRNDLEDPACKIEPAIAEVLGALRNMKSCIIARMSGSGATCFGLFANASATTSAANLIAKDHPDWWLEPTRIAA